LPCYEGLLWYTPIRLQFRYALGLRVPGPATLFELSAALAGVNSCFHLGSRRDPASEQGRWDLPGGVMLLSWSGPTDVRPHTLPAVRRHHRPTIPARLGAVLHDLGQVQHWRMLRQMGDGVKLCRHGFHCGVEALRRALGRCARFAASARKPSLLMRSIAGDASAAERVSWTRRDGASPTARRKTIGLAVPNDFEMRASIGALHASPGVTTN
jgi:hypothetical protein